MLKFSNEFFQQPTKYRRPLKEFAVGRTIHWEGIWWMVVEHQESKMLVEGVTVLKSIGLVGRPRLLRMASCTPIEE